MKEAINQVSKGPTKMTFNNASKDLKQKNFKELTIKNLQGFLAAKCDAAEKKSPKQMKKGSDS